MVSLALTMPCVNVIVKFVGRMTGSGQEIAMWDRIVKIALYGDTDKESYDGVRNKIEASNGLMSFLFACVAVALICGMFVISFFEPGLASSRPVYLFGIVFSIAQIIISLLSKKYPALSYVAVYMAISIFLVYGISIATLTRPEQQTVTFMVLLIFVPLIFVDRPIRMATSLLFYIILFIVMAAFTKTGSVRSVDITDAVIFGILSVISETAVYIVKIKGYVLENKLLIMSETDQLTGLNNRNCYEGKLETYPAHCKKSLCCIYMDGNGLHELNNSKGHYAGDDMLKLIADNIKELFGKNDSYRVGGDEFVIFVADTDEYEIVKMLDEFKDRLAEKDFYVAVGIECRSREGLDMSNLIIKAESKMYKDKNRFYEERKIRMRS